MKRVRHRIIAALLTTVLAQQAIPQVVYGANANTGMDIEEAIERLKKASEDLIPTEEIGGNKIISKDIDLKSSDKVNIIVQFNNEPLLGRNNSTYSLNRNLHKEQESFKKRLKKYADSNDISMNKEKEKSVKEFSGKIDDISINYEFKNSINGFSMTIPSNKIEDISEFPEVKRIWLDREFSIQTQDAKENTSNYSSRSTSFLEDSIKELHKQGIDGSGIKIGILDTGIDYNHPDLVGHFKGRDYIGYDFIDKDNDPMETTVEDWNNSNQGEPTEGSTYYTFHGTHVAGILAGKGENKVEHAVTGIAPKSELYAYRVLGPYGTGPTSAIISAVEKSIEDGLDVINLSLSSAGGDPLDPLSIALNNATLAGVTPIVAAGNSGTRPGLERAMYTLGTPSVAALPITVGAGNFNMELLSMDITISGKTINGRLCASDFGNSYTELKEKSFEIINNAYGSSWDYEDNDAKGKISLVMSGVVSTEEIIKNAEKAGALGVIIYNPSKDIDEYLGEIGGAIPTFIVSSEEGKFINDAIASGDNSIKFGAEKTYTIEGGDLADFSSKGPVFNTFDIKPDIVARGVNVFSTYPEFITHMEEGIDYSTAYRIASGTSMASPYVSGVAALILQKNKEYEPSDVKAAIMNRANEIEGDYSVFEVGSGMLDSNESVNTNILFKIEDQTLNDVKGEEDKITHFTGAMKFGNFQDIYSGDYSKNLIIDNKSNIMKTYEATYEFLPVGPGSKWIGTVDGKENNISFEMPKSIYVHANKEKKINIKPIVPENAQEGIYEGYMTFTNVNDKKDSIRIPFAMRHTTKDMEFTLNNHAITTKLDERNNNRAAEYTMTLNKELEYIDVILMDDDGKKALGYFYRMDNPKGFPLGLSFHGGVVPRECLKLTDDKDNPVSKETFIIKEGKYKIAAVYADKNGETDVVMEDLIIDNRKPVVTTNQSNGIIELKDEDFTVEEYMGQELEAYWIKGNIHDAVIDDLNEMGHADITQANTNIGLYSNNMIIKSAEIKENGDFKLPVTKDMLINNSNFTLVAKGYSTIEANILDNLSLIHKENLRFVGKFKETTIGKGDTANINVNLINRNDVSEIVVKPLLDDMEVIEIKASKELKEYAKANNLTVKVEERGDYIKEYVITLLDKNGEMQSIKGESIADISIKVNSSEISKDFYVDMQAIDSTGNMTMKPLLIEKYPEVVFGAFDLRMDVHLGALNRMDILEYIEDEKKMEIYIVDENSNKIYPNEVKHTTRIFKDLKPMEKVKLVVNVAGHININKEIELLERDKEGNLIVKNIDTSVNLLGGDVNNDNIVDMRDAIAIKNSIGNTGKAMAEDLDGNGIINGYDMAIVAKNYLEVGTGITEKPIEIVDNKKLEDILNEAQKRGKFMGVDPHKKVYEKGEEISIKFWLYDIHSDFTSITQEVHVGQYDEDDNLIHGETVTIQANEGPGSGIINIIPVDGAKTVKYFMMDDIGGVGTIEPTVEVKIE